ncbi:MAG TPA: glycine oxidase ThiO [Thermosynechococcaceae cyanobacterium]
MTDVLIVGGGIIGLAIALELRLQGASVTVLSRRFAEAATQAAAGMLAPQAEQIPPGPMLELCLRSRNLYPDWTRKLEELTGLETGYWDCGILAPVFSAEVSTEDGTEEQVSADSWLDRASLHARYPGLSPEVVGGRWYPQDGQVDNRLLTKALLMALRDLGGKVCEGVTVDRFLMQGDRTIAVQTADGELQAGHYVLATGAWSQALLPVSIVPRKGQMLAVQTPIDRPHPLQTVLFGSEVYLVPRRDGRILIGATSENVGFTSGNTPAGIQALLTQAVRLYPSLQDFPIQELWWGFRPATPDEQPILGASPYENLTLATGHYRNGILLTPITAKLIADRILKSADPLLEPFHWSRFQTRKNESDQ